MAIGMTFVIICGEIDLSVGSVASFSGMIVALLYERDVPTYVAPVICLAMGALIGAVIGRARHQGAHPLLPRHARHAVDLFRPGARPSPTRGPCRSSTMIFRVSFGTAPSLGIQAPIWWTIVLTAAGYYMLHQMAFGRRVFATGGNSVAARFSGVGRTA